MAIEKQKLNASGVAYTGIATHWRTSVGDVIVIAEDVDSLRLICNRIDGSSFNPDLCMPVACFSKSNTAEN